MLRYVLEDERHSRLASASEDIVSIHLKVLPGVSLSVAQLFERVV